MSDKCVWYCNPFLNTDCKKRGCYINGGECYLTTKEEYAIEVKGEKMTWPKREADNNNGPV